MAALGLLLTGAGALAFVMPGDSAGGPLRAWAADDPQPVGMGSGYSAAWSDEFDGNALDRSVWSDQYCSTMNSVSISAHNATVADGVLTLRLSDAETGAQVTTALDSCSPPSHASVVDVGQVVEWRARFPGSDGECLNWPALWAAGPDWPHAGEHDVAEVLDGGKLTGNYHWWDTDSDEADQTRAYTEAGCDGAWHTYSLQRNDGNAAYRIDGVVVASGPTADDGAGESVVMTIGKAGDDTTSYTQGLEVDYVRVWSQPAGASTAAAPGAAATDASSSADDPSWSDGAGASPGDAASS